MTNAQHEQQTGPVEYVDVDAELGIAIQSLMFRRRINQKELSAALGIGQSTVSAKLRGKVGFSISDLIKVARVLDVDAGELLPRLDSNQQPCGYQSAQVSAGEYTDAEWDSFDAWAAELTGALAAWVDGYGVELAWCEWVRSGRANGRQGPAVEALVKGWA